MINHVKRLIPENFIFHTYIAEKRNVFLIQDITLSILKISLTKNFNRTHLWIRPDKLLL